MPIVIGYQDQVPSAVVSGGDYVSTLPLTNIQTDDLQEFARTSSLDLADTQFIIDLGALREIGLIVIGPINASPTLQYRVRGYADAAMTVLKYDTTQLEIESGTEIDWTDTNDWLEWEDVNFWLGIIPSEFADLPLYIIHAIPAADADDGVALRWKFELFDETNSDGYLEFKAMLFRVFRPQFNYAPDSNAFKFFFLEDTETSKGGRETFSEIAVGRTGRFVWPAIEEDEGFDEWMRIALLSRTSRRIFVVPEESDTGERLRLRAYPARFVDTPALAQLNVALGSTSIDVKEEI